MAPCPAEQPLHCGVTPLPTQASLTSGRAQSPQPPSRMEEREELGVTGNKPAHHVSLIRNYPDRGYVHKPPLAQTISSWNSLHSPRCLLQINRQTVRYTTVHILAILFTRITPSEIHPLFPNTQQTMAVCFNALI